MGKLLAAKLRTLIKPGTYRDRSGPYLQLHSAKHRACLYRYGLHGKPHLMVLGTVAGQSRHRNGGHWYHHAHACANYSAVNYEGGRQCPPSEPSVADVPDCKTNELVATLEPESSLQSTHRDWYAFAVATPTKKGEPMPLDQPATSKANGAVKTFVALAAGVAVSFSLAASAAPPPDADPNDPMRLWFRDLMRPDTNTSCCDSSDCRRVESRMTPAGWDAYIHNRWIPVPPDRVLRQDNPTGEAVACYLPNLGIICFVPPPQT